MLSGPSGAYIFKQYILINILFTKDHIYIRIFNHLTTV